MGDVAILATLLSKVTQQYPQLEITVLTRRSFAPMFASLPSVSVITADFQKEHKGVWGLYRLFNTLKLHSFDAVLDMHFVLRTRILKLFFKIFLPKIPFWQIDKGRAEKKALTRAKNKIFKPLKTSYERYGELFDKVGFPLDFSTLSRISAPNCSDKVKLFLNSLDAPIRIGVAPFASHQGKIYPLEKIENLIALLKKQNFDILLFGGGVNEKKQIDNIVQKIPSVHNMVGKFSFEEELQLIAQLNAMIAMDSGNAHLSAMYGVPTLTLWGVTHPFAGFYPYGQPQSNAFLADREKYPLIPTSVFGNHYPSGYEHAIATISEADIAQRVVEIVYQK